LIFELEQAIQVEIMCEMHWHHFNIMTYSDFNQPKSTSIRL